MQVHRSTIEGHTDTVNSIAFARSGRHIYSVSQDRTARLWDLNSGKYEKLTGCTSFGNSVAIDSSESVIAIGFNNCDIKVWGRNDHKLAHTISKVHDESINCVKFMPDGNSIICSSKDSTIKITDLRKSAVLATLEHQDLVIKGSNTQFAVSPMGRYLAIGGSRGQLFVFNLETNKCVDVYDSGSSSSILQTAWDPNNGSRIGTIDENGLLLFWE